MSLKALLFTALPIALAQTIKPLPANGKFDYQIGGAYQPDASVQVVSRDRSDSPVDGLYNICYVNAFQTQVEEKSFWMSSHSDLLLRKADGTFFEDPDWEGEYFLDTSTAAKRTAIAAIVNEWIAGCADAGFDAIEPDNFDTYTRSDGLLTAEDNLAYAKLLADNAHSLGLAFAQKNTAELSQTAQDEIGFDFAVAEECQVNDECDEYIDVYGTSLVEIEYTDNSPNGFSPACAARGSSISVILRDRDVVAQGSSDYHYEEC